MNHADKFGLTKETVEKINSVFSRFSNVHKVLIYGSRAKGDFRPGSDIDLTLVGANLTTTELLKIENELDDLLLPYSIDLSILEKIESPDLRDHIDRVGLVFYQSK